MSSLQSLFRSFERETPLHRLDPRTKLLWVLSISLAAVLVGTPLLLGLLVLSTVPFWALLRPTRGQVRTLLLIFASIAFGVILSQAFFYYWGTGPRLVLLPADFPVLGPITGGIAIYLEGLYYGLVQSFRFIASSSAALALVASTKPGDLIAALSSIVPGRAGRRPIGLPQEIAFMVSAAVSFAPVMIGEAEQILRAMQARGLNLRGLVGMGRGLSYLFFPLITGLLRSGRQLALAADARAFRAARARTSLIELRPGRADYLVGGYAAALIGTSALLSAVGYGGSVLL
ncbi:MAG: energy-coupling factor transporter transmembrane protein EcfT [Methanospirillum sp.]|nr:energy-coupling factor transporter transmembrane protein EcfT [Methanospirillum sp.]